MTRSHGYAVDVSCNDVRAEVLVNDWLAYAARDDHRRVAQVKINAFAHEGKNAIRVRLRKSETSSGVLPPPAFELRFLRGEHDVEGEEPKVLFYLRWEPDELPIGDDVFTEIVHHEWILAEGFGRWSWEDATPYMPEDRPAIEALLARVHAALVGRDLDGYLSLVHVKTEELARSVRTPPADGALELRRFMEIVMQQPAYSVRPLDPRALVLTSNATGRLVEVTRSDGSAPLRVEVDEFAMNLDVTVSKVGGSWKVVR